MSASSTVPADIYCLGQSAHDDPRRRIIPNSEVDVSGNDQTARPDVVDTHDAHGGAQDTESNTAVAPVQPDAHGEQKEAYLLTWNPDETEWKKLDDQIRVIKSS